MLFSICPYSGNVRDFANVRNLHKVIHPHPICAMSLPQLEKLASSEQPEPTLHLLSAALLRVAGCIFATPLPIQSIEFYTASVPRLINAARKCSGAFASSYPRLAISAETSAINLEFWLDSLELISSSKATPPKDQDDPDALALIQYIWNKPAMKAGNEWLRRVLAKSATEWQIQILVDTCANPYQFEASSLQNCKCMLLDYITPYSEQDSANLARILAKLDKAIYDKIGLAALFQNADYELAAKLENEKINTSFSADSNAQFALGALRSQPIEIPTLIEEPTRENFSSKFGYDMAMIMWRTQLRLAKPKEKAE